MTSHLVLVFFALLFGGLILVVKTGEIVLKLHVARQKVKHCVLENLVVQLLFFIKVGLHWCATVAAKSVVFYVIAEKLTKLFRYGLAKVSVVWQLHHCLALKNFRNHKRFAHKRV